MQTIKRPLSTATLFLLAIGLPGAIGLSTTSLPALNSSIVSGSYQRLYEAEFTQNMPMHDLAGATYRALTLALFNEAGPEVVISEDDWLFTGEEFREPAEDVAFASTVAEVRKALEEHAITLIPVIVPDKARLYADQLPRPRSPAMDARYRDTLDVLQSMGFHPADLSEALIPEQAGDDTFMRTDTHWSPLGARLAVEAIADIAAITAIGSAQFESVFETEAAFDGDLLPFVSTGPWETWSGISRETILQPVTTATSSGLGLFDDQEIGLVLIGTSFSARSEFNFAGYLQQITGLELVNLAVEGRGPFEPMQNALESGAITEIAPRFVIWEIPERYIHTRSLP